MTAYLRRTYRLAAPLAGLEEDLVAELWDAGTLGAESVPEAGGGLRLAAYFSRMPEELGRLEERWRRRGVELLGEERVPEADWMASYRARARPFPLGEHLWIDPREPSESDASGPPPPAGRSLLRLPVRQAFGIGTHESTRLAVRLLEELDLTGRRVLDVGTGTGVLAFAALLAGARFAAALDIDPVAVFHARGNARLNRLAPHLAAGTAAVLGAPGEPGAPGGRRFEAIAVNILPELILPEMAVLAAWLAPAGELVLSGVLAERGPEVLAHLASLGLRPRRRLEEGEWVAFRLVGEGG